MAKARRHAAQEEEPSPSARSKLRRNTGLTKSAAFLAILAAAPTSMAQSCISLEGSKMCPAWNASSITTTGEALGIFPFLAFVKDTASFDQQLNSYVKTSWAQRQYLDRFGCSGIDLTNTTDLYARFSSSVICNSIIQTSRAACGLTEEQAMPLCADSCAQYAQSEGRIIESSELCQSPTANTEEIIRSNFLTCSEPDDSLKTSRCINGIENEQENCGFGESKIGLCGYCAAGGMNSTDTCCYNSGAETICAGVVLPSIGTSISLPTGTQTPSASASATAAPVANGDQKKGLSTGVIVGIVIGSVAGLALLIGLIFLALVCLRRKRPASKDGSVFNQPSPVRKGPGMAQNGSMTQAPPGFEVLPGGRIARMSALEGHSGDSPPRGSSGLDGATAGAGYGTAAGYGAGYAGARNRHGGSSSSSFGDSPQSDLRANVLRPPPTGRRHGSLSSNSALGDHDPNSPISSGNGMSSPNVNSQQSEQLPYFKDYYSQDEIHPGDKVATLWAYQPRAGDEFMLERGDMLKVVGIWDDGWATGVMIPDKAEDWEAAHNAQRDSGVSNTSGVREASPPITGEIKAFPLVCVCLPEHWKKTIEGDGSTETNSSGMPHPPPSMMS